MLVQRQTEITANLVSLCRYLRTKGYTITATEESDALKGMVLLPITTEFKYVSLLKAVVCKNKFQFVKFEEDYLDYKYEIEKAVDSKIKKNPEHKQNPPTTKQPSIEELKNWLFQNPVSEELTISSYSDIESLIKKDFSTMTGEEVDFILQLMQKLSNKILRQRSRVKKISKSKRHIDLSMTIRKNLRKGTEINDIVFSKLKEKKLKLVLLCDVSRSMDLYSRFFVQMIYAFQNSYDRIETFVFSTALHQVTKILNEYTFDKAFEIISDRVPQWSGGTKIGYCLQSFGVSHAHGLVDRKTVVMILSDGWDTGEPDLIRESMKMIYKKARKVLWLNPLAGNPEFKPDVIGLQSVLPYIDKLYAAHNMESLRKVMHLL